MCKKGERKWDKEPNVLSAEINCLCVDSGPCTRPFN
jgi:hypothetical protein